jgi:hypothetical protein
VWRASQDSLHRLLVPPCSICVCVCVCVSVCDSFRTIVHHVCVQERVYIIQIIQMQNVKIGSNSSSVRGLKGGRTDR